MLMEMYNQKREKVNWTPFIFGSLTGLVPWIWITIYLVGSGSMSSSPVPTFVYFTFIPLAVFFFSFAFKMILQYMKVGRWKNYLYGSVSTSFSAWWKRPPWPGRCSRERYGRSDCDS
jgi:hypothetical protein